MPHESYGTGDMVIGERVMTEVGRSTRVMSHGLNSRSGRSGRVEDKRMWRDSVKSYMISSARRLL